MIGRVLKFRDRWFRRQDYMVDGEARPRMVKWTLLSTRWFSIFFHRFNGPDWTRDPHNHPTDFISIGLKGWYAETVYNADGQALYRRIWRAPWLRRFPARHIHRMCEVGPKGAYTMCLVSPVKQNWGFFVDGKFTTWRDYVKGYRSQRADRDHKAA
jgi:hypothetical protein